jgi:hypothetical protein
MSIVLVKNLKPEDYEWLQTRVDMVDNFLKVESNGKNIGYIDYYLKGENNDILWLKCIISVQKYNGYGRTMVNYLKTSFPGIKKIAGEAKEGSVDFWNAMGAQFESEDSWLFEIVI